MVVTMVVTVTSVYTRVAACAAAIASVSARFGIVPAPVLPYEPVVVSAVLPAPKEPEPVSKP